MKASDGLAGGGPPLFLAQARAQAKALVDELLFGTIKTVAIFTASFLLFFTIMAFTIHRYSAMEQDYGGTFRMVAAGLLFPAYAALGALCGLAYGAASSAKRKVALLEEGIHRVAGPLMEAAIGMTPADGREIGIRELKGSLEKLTSGNVNNRRGISGLLSIPGAMAGILPGSVLRVIRAAALAEFLDSMEKSGRSAVSVNDVEAFTRKRLVSSAAAVFKGRLDLIQYACCLAAFVFSIPAAVALLL